jgi:hypothetical protein
MITVVMTCWKRFQNLEEIIKTWLSEPEVTEFILWDNSGEYKTNLPIKLINCNFNMSPAVRYSISIMSKNDIIINADDDLLPHQGMVSSLLSVYKETNMVGISGLKFKGTSSFFDYEYVSGNEIKSPTVVDCISGPVSLTHKNNLLGYNYSQLNIYHLELHLQGMAKRSFRKMPAIVPPVKYTELVESRDNNALFLKPEARDAKNQLYKKYFGPGKYL